MSDVEPAGHPSAPARGDAQPFSDKWRARWPEWRIAEVFVPVAERPLILAWAALQQALSDAAWGGSDPRPGEAKLLWWQEELHGWAQGRRRHPLGQLLQRQAVDWSVLAVSLPMLAEARARPRDAVDAAAQVQPVLQAIAAIEQRLFTAIEPPSAATIAAISACWLHARATQQGEGGVPLSCLARAGADPALPAWRAELARTWPRDPAGNRFRRLWAALALGRLQQPEEHPLRPWRALLLAWRAARN